MIDLVQKRRFISTSSSVHIDPLPQYCKIQSNSTCVCSLYHGVGSLVGIYDYRRSVLDAYDESLCTPWSGKGFQEAVSTAARVEINTSKVGDNSWHYISLQEPEENPDIPSLFMLWRCKKADYLPVSQPLCRISISLGFSNFLLATITSHDRRVHIKKEDKTCSIGNTWVGLLPAVT